jgi:uncharacterized iron-regulated membrane protein
MREAEKQLAAARAAREAKTRSRKVVDFLGLLMAVALVMLAFTFKSEHDSCARQAPVRESSNARRLTVNQIVSMVESNKIGTEQQRLDLAAKTARIPELRKLHCGLPWPDTQ